MLTASVSNLDLFRVWQEDDELDLDWLLRRIRHEEPQTEEQLAGVAFHQTMEKRPAGEFSVLIGYAAPDGSDDKQAYRFDFDCDTEIVLPELCEVRIEKQYGDLLVRGRIDCWGAEISDYKTTEQFDAERLMEGYQWRYYLDMSGFDTFCWQVFVMRHVKAKDGDSAFLGRHYLIHQAHTLRQRRYPGLRADCERLAREYVGALARELQPA